MTLKCVSCKSIESFSSEKAAWIPGGWDWVGRDRNKPICPKCQRTGGQHNRYESDESETETEN